MPAVIILLALYVAPIVNVLILSVTDPQPGFGNYAKIIESDTVGRLIWTTIRLCLITTFFAVLLGYVVAYAMFNALAHVRRRMMAILLVSFWISVLVRSFAWLMLLGHNGLVNNALMATGLINTPLPLVRNELGVLIGMTEYMVPYAILPLLANMQGIDHRVITASRSLGASRIADFSARFPANDQTGHRCRGTTGLHKFAGLLRDTRRLGRRQGSNDRRVYFRAASRDRAVGHRSHVGDFDVGKRTCADVCAQPFHEAQHRLRRGRQVTSSPASRVQQIAAWTILLVLIIPSLVAIPVSVTSKTYLSLPWDRRIAAALPQSRHQP